MFPVLLHPELYRRLRRSERGARARVWKTLRRLRDGHWGGGTRVKRLRGVGRPVYEARTDSGDRLLFTMVRSAPGDHPERLSTHLQVWDLVEHDDALRTARRNRAPEAEFLELPALEQFEIDAPPLHPDAAFKDLGGAAGPQDEPLLHFLLPPDGFDPAPEEGITGGVRWFRLDPGALTGEDEFQRLFDGGAEELELKLTREQYEILQAPGPVLLAGSAGSGKTTLAAHRLATAACAAEEPSALYLSYSASLVEHARSLVRDLTLARGGDPESNPPRFSTFGDLYRSLVPREFRDHQARPMTEALFREWFRKAGRPLDPALVWEELRSILKGACLSPAQAMLGEEAYFELGRKRAPLFVNERPEIYRIAQRYQEWLAEEGRSDRIDLCRRAFAEVRRSRARRWDVVVCDEVQDLTELEVAFVLSLSARRDLAGVVLTGDTQQIVNPSGFRWAEARRLAARASQAKIAPPVLRLRKNLRSAGPVVELANRLLLLRREVFGRTEEDDPEEATLAGPLPIEVPAGEEEVLAAIEGFGPRCAVLTLDDPEAERLRLRLGTSRVFHVREAKGLEFETVVLWKLLGPDRDLVDRFARSPAAPENLARLEREPRFSRLLQHLYVAVTRCRRNLAIHEGTQPDPFWGDERFRGRIESEAVEALDHLFHPTASPGEWAGEGDYFFERGHFRQAAECYRRAGLAERENEALALAGEALEDWAGALERWRSLGMEREARLCELRLLERRREWAAAARGWEEAGQFREASRCWERSGDERRGLAALARAAEAEGDWSLAGASWFELGAWEEAARGFRAAGDRARTAAAVARHCEETGAWSRAAAAYRVAGEAGKSARCRARALDEGGRPDRAARLWERLGETERAGEMHARAGDWSAVARLQGLVPESRQRILPKVRELIESGSLSGAAEAAALARTRMEILRPLLPQVPWFVFVENDRIAWQEFCSLKLLEQRCEALRAEATGAWSQAARHWEEAGDPRRAAEARRRRIEAIRDPVRRARAWRAVQAFQGGASREKDEPRDET
jgi:tetratricopeptide (TPR) repeat protein